MPPREAARRRIRAAIWCGYACLFLAALALNALDDDEDQAPVDDELVRHLAEREGAARAEGYARGWNDHRRHTTGGG